jgi:hypothetical protein
VSAQQDLEQILEDGKHIPGEIQQLIHRAYDAGFKAGKAAGTQSIKDAVKEALTEMKTDDLRRGLNQKP